MQVEPTTRDRHALRWVLGVGLVFVVVVAMALQVARRRALARWESVVTPWEDKWQRSGIVLYGGVQAGEWSGPGT